MKWEWETRIFLCINDIIFNLGQYIQAWEDYRVSQIMINQKETL